MKKVLMVLLLVFVFMMPHVSAERLLNIGPELLYQRIVQLNETLDDSYKVRVSDITARDNNLSYIFHFNKFDNHMTIMLTADKYGYVEQIFLNGHRNKFFFSSLFLVITASQEIATDDIVYLLKNLKHHKNNNLEYSIMYSEHMKKKLSVARSIDKFGKDALFIAVYPENL